jgi:two-component system OmpR family sensor kinase
MLATLERALERERQFVNEASHELRTPITLLTSRVQLARRRPRSLAEHERILDELQVDLDRLARLAEQLLELGRAAGQEESGSGDLALVTARMVEEERHSFPPGADVSVELDTPTAPVQVAELDIERILTNILDNAALHGAAPVHVTVDRPTASWARLVVTDSGPGMSPPLLDTATQRFTRAEEARTRRGAGLGLALVRALVERTGAELRLCHAGRHTTEGQAAPVPCDHGSAMTVTVLLPAQAVEARELVDRPVDRPVETPVGTVRDS